MNENMKTTFEGLSFVMPENWMKHTISVDSVTEKRNNLYDPMGEMIKQKKNEIKEIRYEIDVEEFHETCKDLRWEAEFRMNLHQRLLDFAILVKEHTTKTPTSIEVITGIGKVRGFDLEPQFELAEVSVNLKRIWNAPMDKITVTFIFE